MTLDILFLPRYLIDNAVASDIRIVDKKAPFMAFLSEDHKAAILGRPDVIEYVQADISDRDMCEDAFRPPRTGTFVTIFVFPNLCLIISLQLQEVHSIMSSILPQKLLMANQMNSTRRL